MPSIGLLVMMNTTYSPCVIAAVGCESRTIARFRDRALKKSHRTARSDESGRTIEALVAARPNDSEDKELCSEAHQANEKTKHKLTNDGFAVAANPKDLPKSITCD